MKCLVKDLPEIYEYHVSVGKEVEKEACKLSSAGVIPMKAML